MTGQYPNNPNLLWCELLSRAEIQQWLSTGTVPPRLVVDFDRAGIYRFVFEECRDDTTAHTACYVGETVNLCHRMKDYFPTTPRAWGHAVIAEATLGRMGGQRADFAI